MLKVSFPHMGNGYIPFRCLLSELGADPVVPPPISQRTITLGTKIAPEFACFPLKINLGNYIEAIENGAEMLFMAGGIGPCRFGYYGEVQKEILHEAGYDIDFLVLEAPKTHPRELWDKIKRYFPRHRIPDITRAIHLSWLKAEALDTFDRLANQTRPYEKVCGKTTQLQMRHNQKVDDAWSVKDIKAVLKNSLAELENLPKRENYDDPQKLRIMMVGEIYMVLEPRVNFQMERTLGELGAEVERTIYFTDWVREHLVMSILNPNWHRMLQSLAKPYLRNFVGGHGLETVAHTVSAGVNRFHGVIQIAPFTCMPEIIAMQTLPTVSKELNIPVLSVIIDEHSAEAGIKTRLEAFVDLLQHRRLKQKVGGRRLEVVSGH